MKHIPQLDGLRAVAILLVLLTHFWTYPDGHEFLNRIAAAGWLGVDLFFVLSGFLITRILWASREQPGYYRSFYARRALRIFPLYYALLLIVLVALPMAKDLPPALAADGWLYWLYLGNFAIAAGGWQLFLLDITWSLSLEEQFYLLWPATIRRMTAKTMLRFCVALIIAMPMARLIAWQYLDWKWLYMLMRADSFAVGAVIAVAMAQGYRLDKVSRWAFGLGAPLLAGLVLTDNYGRETMLVGTVGYSLTALVSASALVLAMQSRVFLFVPLRHIGKVSYGIYIFHPLCLMATVTALGMVGFKANGLDGAFIQLVTVSGVAVAVATISYRIYEQPFLRLKRFFEPNRASTRVVAQTD